MSRLLLVLALLSPVLLTGCIFSERPLLEFGDAIESDLFVGQYVFSEKGVLKDASISRKGKEHTLTFGDRVLQGTLFNFKDRLFIFQTVIVGDITKYYYLLVSKSDDYLLMWFVDCDRKQVPDDRVVDSECRLIGRNEVLAHADKASRSMPTGNKVLTLLSTPDRNGGSLRTDVARPDTPEPRTFNLKLCNHTSITASAAVSHRNPSDSSRWMLKSWFTVEPGACNLFGPFPRGYFYLYAYQHGRPVYWKGEKPMLCVAPRATDRSLVEGEQCLKGEARVGMIELQATSEEFSYELRPPRR